MLREFLGILLVVFLIFIVFEAGRLSGFIEALEIFELLEN